MTHDSRVPPIAAIVVMGVSGSGKTTIAALLAGMLHWRFADADDFHPVENVLKMRGAVALTDADRLPWLHRIAEWVDATRQSGERSVLACSALKRSYRTILIGDRRDVRLVYLKGDRELIARRMTARHSHYMPLALLDSQLETLEEPGDDEHPLLVSIEATPSDIVARIITALQLQSS